MTAPINGIPRGIIHVSIPYVDWSAQNENNICGVSKYIKLLQLLFTASRTLTILFFTGFILLTSIPTLSQV